jgi:hypothetical protein
MSEDTMVNSPSSTTPTSTTTVDLPSTGREPTTTSSPTTGTSLKDTVIALDKMLR